MLPQTWNAFGIKEFNTIYMFTIESKKYITVVTIYLLNNFVKSTCMFDGTWNDQQSLTYFTY